MNIKTLREEAVPIYTVTSLGEYCDLIDSVWSEWKREISRRQSRPQQPAHFYCGELSPWFRGLTTKTYKLEPTFSRFFDEIHGQNGFIGVQKQASRTDMEKYLLERFKSLSSPILEKIPKDDIEWSMLMRHHGAESRLLDWTKGSFVALYLALRKTVEVFSRVSTEQSNNFSDAAVWMLEPRRLSEACSNTRRIIGTNEHSDKELIAKYSKENSSEIYPLPIIPNLTSPRVTAHLGRFTLHPFNEGSLERFAEDKFRSDEISYLVKIEIPSCHHMNIFRSLRSAGIADLNFTQDLDGIAKELGLRIRIGKYDHNINMLENNS